MIIVLGAAVYHAIEDFDKSILDCNKAIEINKNYVKVMTAISHINYLLNSHNFTWSIVLNYCFRLIIEKLKL